MRLQTITVDNFKSLVGFKLDLAKFTCLIGLNGSGKSTVLQFIDFLAQQVCGKIDEWLENRGWVASDLRSKLTPKKNIEFRVVLEDKTHSVTNSWGATFNPQLLRCT